MSGSYDQRAAACQAADLAAAGLNRVSGLLEEVATFWRRAQLYGQQPSSITPGSLQGTARSLAEALRRLLDADSKKHPALAFAAAAQLADLKRNAARSAAVTADHPHGTAGIWAAVEGALLQVDKQLWNLIRCLAEIGEPSPAEGLTAGLDPVTTRDGPPSLPTAGPGESRRALAIQRAAIDALPEAELRRLLVLIGGTDPAALRRAAAIYTETFCAVTEMKSSVDALRPVLLLVLPISSTAAPAD